MTYFIGINHSFWDRGEVLSRLLLDAIFFAQLIHMTAYVTIIVKLFFSDTGTCLYGKQKYPIIKKLCFQNGGEMAGKAFPASPVHAQPVIYVWAKRPMANFLSNRVGKVALRWLCRLKWLRKFCMACVQLNTITKLEGFSMMIRNLFVCMSVRLYVRPPTVQAIN